MKPVVMIVDDEINVLAALERDLQMMRKKWDLVFYSDPQEALNHLADGPIDLIVSDLGMPGMDGVEFLGKVAERAPHTIRFGLSEADDHNASFNLLDVCHQVLTKPCDIERLVQHARRALATRSMVPNLEMQTKVSRIRELPARRDVHDLIIRELRSNNPAFEAIAALISEDIALAAKVLQLASSDFFSPDGATPGLVTAVTRLGIQRIGAVVRSHHVETECADRIAREFSLEALWLHSVACATVGQAIAAFEKLPTATVEGAFVAGLLHDIGRLVMAASEPELYASTIAPVADPDSERGLEAETRIFKSAHPQVGAYLVGLWGFSQDIIDAVAYHHSPSSCPTKDLGPLALLHAAEAFSRLPGDGVLEFDSAYFRSLGIEKKLADWRAVADALTAGEYAI